MDKEKSFQLYNVRAYVDGTLRAVDIKVQDGVIVAIRPTAAVTPAKLWLLPGVIDDHVHFREPGLTDKADIESESRAAAAGGVTTVMDMPNVIPTTTTPEALEEKRALFDKHCLVRHGLFYGITNDNIEEALRIPDDRICGYKVFLGSSTGGMLMNDMEKLKYLLSHTQRVVAVHSEDEEIIRRNREHFLRIHPGDDLGIAFHPMIRSTQACQKATMRALQAFEMVGGNLHICHVSTATELDLIRRVKQEKLPQGAHLSAEACIGHLWFSADDYKIQGSLIKVNPAIKSLADRTALRHGLIDGTIDIIATDHAPHLLNDKKGGALKAASGMPSVQFSLLVMLEMMNHGILTLPDIVRLMSENPAKRYKLWDRGAIREGLSADFVLIDPHAKTDVNRSTILSKCGWSPWEDEVFHHKILTTWVQGVPVWQNS